MLTDLRPMWNRIGICKSVCKIQDWISTNPDFIFAGTHLSDGLAITSLKRHAIKYPIVLYTHQLDEDEARRSLSNIVKFIYEPVSDEDIKDAVKKLESFCGTKKLENAELI